MTSPLPLEIAEAACEAHGLPAENAPAIAELGAWTARMIVAQTEALRDRAAAVLPAVPAAESAEARRTAVAIVAAYLRGDTDGAAALTRELTDARAAANTLGAWLASLMTETFGDDAEQLIHRTLRDLS